MDNFDLSSEDIENLLQVLLTDGYHTSAELAEKLAISERTARTRIKRFAELLEENGAMLESKPHYGYRLQIVNLLIFDSFRQRLRSPGVQSPYTGEKLMAECVLFLLLKQEYYTIDTLSEMFYVSRPIISNAIKSMENSLSRYHLAVERRPKYGIKITGSQFDIRLCAAHLIPQTSYFCSEEDLNRLAEVVKSTLFRCNILMADTSFANFLAVLYVMMLELIFHHPYDPQDTPIQDIGFEIQYGANEIKTVLEKTYGIQIPDAEKKFIAIHLGGKRYLNYTISTAWNNIVSEEILKTVENMLSVIKTYFDVDFSGNFDLQMRLCQHMVPLRIRLRFGIQTENPMLELIRHSYSYAYNIAFQAAVVIQKQLGAELNEGEIGYLAMLFELALEQSEKSKKNILLICSEGVSGSQLLQFKLKQRYGEYIDKILITNRYALKNVDLKNIDYIFTTVPIMEKLDKPIIEIGALLKNDAMPTLETALRNPAQEYLFQFYSPDLFFSGIAAETKEEAIHCICEKIAQVRVLPDRFERRVLTRESLGATDFGNWIAMPHPVQRSNQTIVAIGILEKPILWSKHYVQMVLLVSLADGIDELAQDFWRRTSEFMMDEALVREAIQDASYDKFLQLLHTESQPQ